MRTGHSYSRHASPVPTTSRPICPSSNDLELGTFAAHQAVVFFFLDFVLRFVRTLGLSASMPALQISA